MDVSSFIPIAMVLASVTVLACSCLFCRRFFTKHALPSYPITHDQTSDIQGDPTTASTTNSSSVPSSSSISTRPAFIHIDTIYKPSSPGFTSADFLAPPTYQEYLAFDFEFNDNNPGSLSTIDHHRKRETNEINRKCSVATTSSDMNTCSIEVVAGTSLTHVDSSYSMTTSASTQTFASTTGTYFNEGFENEPPSYADVMTVET